MTYCHCLDNILRICEPKSSSSCTDRIAFVGHTYLLFPVILNHQLDQGTPLSYLSLTPNPYTLNADFTDTSSETTRPGSKKKYKIPLTIYYLSFLGGYNIGNSVHRMMKKLGTKRLWSEYILKGRKGIKAFQELVICRVLIKACLKNNGEAKANEIEEAISETRNYAPNQHGGVKYKVPEQKKKQINFRVEETDSDF